MTGLEQLGAVLGALTVIIGAVPALRRAAWTLLLVPSHLQKILEKLNSLDDVKASADLAADEWRGATAAVRAMAHGHSRKLADHESRISAMERWRARVEGEHA